MYVIISFFPVYVTKYFKYLKLWIYYQHRHCKVVKCITQPLESMLSEKGE